MRKTSRWNVTPQNFFRSLGSFSSGAERHSTLFSSYWAKLAFWSIGKRCGGSHFLRVHFFHPPCSNSSQQLLATFTPRWKAYPERWATDNFCHFDGSLHKSYIFPIFQRGKVHVLNYSGLFVIYCCFIYFHPQERTSHQTKAKSFSRILDRSTQEGYFTFGIPSPPDSLINPDSLRHVIKRGGQMGQ